jgi:proline iminopeptidase
MLRTGYRLNYRANAALNAAINALDPADLVRRCHGLDVPVLVIEGALDPRPNAAVDTLVSSLLNVTRNTVASGAHYPWLDAPEEFRSAVAEWLAGVEGAT